MPGLPPINMYLAVGRGDGALANQHEFARVLLHRRLQRGVGLMAAAGHQGFVIVEGDDVKDKIRHVGAGGS